MKIIELTSRRRDTAGGRAHIRTIQKQARHWVIRLDGEELTDAEKLALARWVARSEVHRRVFHDTAATWMALDELSSLLDQLQGMNVNNKIPEAGLPDSFFPARYRHRYLLIALMVAGVFIIPVTVGLFEGLGGNHSGIAEYMTAVGEVRDIRLPDQSSVSLNTDSRMEVNYQDKVRFIHLEKGEAYFDVARNPDIPFLVYAGSRLVWAVGTEFSVSTVDGNLDVVVTEGKVEVGAYGNPAENIMALVDNIDEQGDSLVPLSQGQKAVFSSAEGSPDSVQELESVSITKALAWRDGMLIFDDDSLESVVKQINRYTSARIVISDSSLSELRFGGYFRIGDIDAVLAALSEEFSIGVEEVDEDLFYLSSQR